MFFSHFFFPSQNDDDGFPSRLRNVSLCFLGFSFTAACSLSPALQMGNGDEDDDAGAARAAPAQPAKKPAFSARLMQMKFMQRGAERKNLAAATAAAASVAKKEEARKEEPITSGGPAASAAATAGGAPRRRRFVLVREAEPRPTSGYGDGDDGDGGDGGVPSTSTAATGPPALGRLSFNGANDAVDRLLAEAARAAALGGGTGEGKAVDDEEMVAAAFGGGGGGGTTSGPGSSKGKDKERKPLKRPGILGILQSKVQKPGGGNGGSKKKKQKKKSQG